MTIGRSSGRPVGPEPDGPSTLLPWLLRRANQRYRAAVRERLSERGFAGLPQPGYWALTVIAAGGSEANRLVGELGVSKQAVSKLVDTLVTGGYVERQPNRTDRRRTDLVLSASGRRAAGVITDAVRETDDALARELGPERFAELVDVLRTLAQRPG